MQQKASSLNLLNPIIIKNDKKGGRDLETNEITSQIVEKIIKRFYSHLSNKMIDDKMIPFTVSQNKKLLSKFMHMEFEVQDNSEKDQLFQNQIPHFWGRSCEPVFLILGCSLS